MYTYEHTHTHITHTQRNRSQLALNKLRTVADVTQEMIYNSGTSLQLVQHHLQAPLHQKYILTSKHCSIKLFQKPQYTVHAMHYCT